MENRAEKRRRMKRMRDEFLTRWKFVEQCGCGLNVDADSRDEAITAMIQNYVPHIHNRGKPHVELVVFERPGIQVGKVLIDFDYGKAHFEPGGPPFPCGTGYDQVCASCGTRNHYETPPIEHPELYQEDCGDYVNICGLCFRELQRALGE